MTNNNEIRTVYVIGLQEHGGAWIPNEQFWTDEQVAYAECDKRREDSTQNGKYKPLPYKVFHLYRAAILALLLSVLFAGCAVDSVTLTVPCGASAVVKFSPAENNPARALAFVPHAD